MKKATRGPIQRWGDEVGWKRRVKAVCKPCWELKYCPYGPLVETFPLRANPDERSCRIFGHDCPVFYVAEPLTETKDLRNIGRSIPRPMQFRVLKRDNQICAVCKHPVLDGDIHFDHIIPWSKGGPTEEHNIRLLCGDCNRKRGPRFEADYLVGSVMDHATKPVGSGFVKLALDLVADARNWEVRHGRLPSPKDICRFVGRRKPGKAENAMHQVLRDLKDFFTGPPPAEVSPPIFQALRTRWGYADGTMRKLRGVVGPKTDLPALIEAEADLIRRLGWSVRVTDAEARRWARL